MFFMATVFLFAMGFLILVLSHGNSLLYYFYFDILGGIVMGMSMFLIGWRLYRGRCNHYFNMEKKNLPLYEFIYRIGAKVPIYGKRIPGMGFSKIKGLGIVQELGKASSYSSVYSHGDKSCQFVLQDVAHTPDPKFAGFCSWLTSIGFNSLTEVNSVMNGHDADTMAKVWMNIKDYRPKKTVDVVVEKLQTINDAEKKFMEKTWKDETRKDVLDAHNMIDKMKNIRVNK